MATQPNHGRDIKIDILRVLAEADGPLTVREIQDRLTGPAVSDSAVRGNLHSALYWDWVQVDGVGERGGACWSITVEGRRVAEARGLTGRADG